MRRWTVGGALIRHGTGLVMVANRRRDGSLDWTPPGGVIDEGESVLDGLAREVLEETGLAVTQWQGLAYRVEVEAPDLGWLLQVEVWEAEVDGLVERLGGDLDAVVDPDGIVEITLGACREDALELIQASPPWVREPLGDWLAGGGERGAEPGMYRFVLEGTDRHQARARRTA